MSEKPCPNLSNALVSAQASARAVGKDSKNKHHGYDYASAEAMIAEARACLGSAGLALSLVGRTFTPIAAGAPKDQSGKDPIGRVEIRYKLIHTSGESMDIASSTWVVPEKGRPADKAEAAAVTSDLGYTLRGLLLLERVMDDGIDGRDDRDYDRRPERGNEDRSPEPAREPERQPAAQVPRGAPANTSDRFDPAHEALCIEFQRRAAVSGSTEHDELPGDVIDAIAAAKLPKPLRDSALAACFTRAFQLIPDAGKELPGDPPAAEQLGEWIPLIKNCQLGPEAKAIVQAEFTKHDIRTGFVQPEQQAA